MAKYKNLITAVLTIIIIATLAFIWGNSCVSKEVSQEQSDGVYEVVKDTIDAVVGENVVTPLIFRKLAHAVEFFLLGAEIVLLYLHLFGFSAKKLFEMVSLGLFVAVIDESIQILSKRGAEVLDVTVDMLGYLIGGVLAYAFVFAVWLVWKKIKQKKRGETTE